jgi:glycosidase
VFVRDFSPAGNLQGVIAGLDRIEAVGANIVWLMPIHPVGVANRKGSLGSSYSISDFRAVNPDYGSEADVRALISAVHARGMKLILDWVPNHTAWDHVWMREHPDFYLRNEQGEISVPVDNDGKVTDWTDVADLDYSNPAMRSAMIADMRYWLDTYGIDGFRVDVAGMVPDEFWREAVPELRAVDRPILLLAEWGESKMHELGFDLTYAWDTYHRLKDVWGGDSASTFVAQEVAELRTLPVGGRRLRFSTNHDETAWDQPPVVLFDDPAGARAAFVTMALLPGTPLIYNGQEVESPQKLPLFEKEAVVWEQEGADSARAFYRRVIDLARTHEAFSSSDVQKIETSAPYDVIAYQRAGVLVLVNARPADVELTVAGFEIAGARDLLSGVVQRGGTVLLPPYGAVVLER